jgi:hypothetical protein
MAANRSIASHLNFKIQMGVAGSIFEPHPSILEINLSFEVVRPNEPDQPNPNFDPEGQPDPTQPDYGP